MGTAHSDSSQGECRTVSHLVGAAIFLPSTSPLLFLPIYLQASVSYWLSNTSN